MMMFLVYVLGIRSFATLLINDFQPVSSQQPHKIQATNDLGDSAELHWDPLMDLSAGSKNHDGIFDKKANSWIISVPTTLPTKFPPTPTRATPDKERALSFLGRSLPIPAVSENRDLNPKSRGLDLSPDAPIDCSHRRREKIAEMIAQVQVVGDRDFIPPTTDMEMIRICRNRRRALGKIGRYSRECLPPMVAQLMRVVISSVSRFNRNVCRDRTKRIDTIRYMKCLTPERAGPLHACSQAAALKVQWLASQKIGGPFDTDQFIPALCCLAHTGESCMRARGREVCMGALDNPAEAADHLVDVLREEFLGDVMGIACRRHSSEETCRELLPEVMNAFDGIDDKFETPNYDRNETALSETTTEAIPPLPIPMLDLLGRPDFV